jgi:hypothetical protein
MTETKQRYLTPAGMECTILRETDHNVTIMIEDPIRRDAYEWTTDRPNFEKRYKPKRTVKVFYSSGDIITKHIIGTNDEIIDNHLGKPFEDTGIIAMSVHVDEYMLGLMVRNIENYQTDRVKSVRRETVKVDDTKSFDEIILILYSDDEVALNDAWVYDLKGEWLNTIGYKHETVRR